jgi:hypothetical protein
MPQSTSHGCTHQNLHSCWHEASKCPKLYQQDPDFTTTYQFLGIGVNVIDFHIQDRLLCHLGHLYFLARERAKMIWEARYGCMAGHVGSGENYGHSIETFLLAKTST